MFANYACIWDRIAEEHPRRAAVQTATARQTYQEFRGQAESAARALKHHGFDSGDRLAFYLHNTPEYLVLFYACLKIGVIPVSINYRYGAREVSELISTSTPRGLIYAHQNQHVVETLTTSLSASALPDVLIHLDADDHTPHSQSSPFSSASWNDFLSTAAADSAHQDPLTPPPDDAELYVFTGGTTGIPKAVVWGVSDLLHVQQQSIYGPLGWDHPDDVEQAIDLVRNTDRAPIVTLPLAPFIHATALFTAMNTLVAGGTVVINPAASLNPDDAARLIMDQRVTQLVVAGDAVALPLLDALEQHAGTQDVPLRSVISSGMRFSDDTKARIHALGEVSIVDILASTEGGPYAMALSHAASDLPARFRLTPDAVVLDDHDEDVSDVVGALGLLAYQGALPRGYLDEPVKTQETYPIIRGVRTARPGDYVQVEQNRYIQLLGRGSSVVNSGGEKVFPGEVEEIILQLDDVTDAVVFGVHDPTWGERVAASVTVSENSTLTAQEVFEHVGAHLAGYKKPRVVMISERSHRGPTGKINMRDLRTSVTDHGTRF
ncbi:AMP-binding protein [Citricoccus muralis]|uniref:AMP-binding protein n=1 Tax=Citricoccus muralis TaxID=169134 RepID=A0ABY8H696_9MICC|nr:AMP-binding protein [Citricoccus muralis]WFP16167.1 AMP-binding protein [Citricoccus muralis]